MFGVLAMLKSIADHYKYASEVVFKKMKKFFIHAAGEEIKLWSLWFSSNIYHLYKEDRFDIKPEFSRKADYLQHAVSFFLEYEGKESLY